MSIDTLTSTFGDYAKDIVLNLSTVLTEGGAPDLTPTQIAGVALASSYATKNKEVTAAIEAECGANLDPANIRAAKGAATIMAMNNVYYRYLHNVGDQEIKKLPARLRMNFLANSGIAKQDFELMSLAVSSINGCGMCMEAHTHELIKAGLTKQGIQSAVRIAAVVNAVAAAASIGS